MKFVPQTASRLVGRTLLKATKHSPRVMFVVGIAGAVTSTVLACRATLKLEETLENADKRLQTAHEKGGNKKDVTKAYAVNVGEVAKLYAPAAIIGGVSIGLLTKSHLDLSKRNAALAAAYSTLHTGFSEYRERVREEIGEEKEQDIYRGIKDVSIVEDGKKINIKTYDPSKLSMYNRMFDESNPNWEPGPGYNHIFILNQQNYANDLLKARGYVYLNDVLKGLGFDDVPEGQIVGWILGEDTSDNYVDFGLMHVRNADFVNHREPSIILDFNVDGYILDKI
jgi:hypothetical protein